MNDTSFADKLITFGKKRFFEITGIFLILLSIAIFASLISYAPEDPNFLSTNEKNKIENLLGIYGSVISDFLFQIAGIIAFLIPINVIFYGFFFNIK